MQIGNNFGLGTGTFIPVAGFLGGNLAASNVAVSVPNAILLANASFTISGIGQGQNSDPSNTVLVAPAPAGLEVRGWPLTMESSGGQKI